MHKSLKFFHLFFLTIIVAGPARPAPLYTALGASDAIGTGSSLAPAVPNGGYVFLIADWLDARYPAWTLHNLGVSGYTTPNIRDSALNAAIADQPDLITLWTGGNDIKNSVLSNQTTDSLIASFEPAYTSIIHRLRTETNAFIITANVPDFSRIPIASYFGQALKDLAKADSNAVNTVIANVATANNVPVVDLYSNPASYDPKNFSSDMFHPNDSGYAIMAQQYEAILQAQAWRRVSGLGDVDGDGGVGVNDTKSSLEIVAGLITASDRQSVAADTAPPGGDDTVGLDDAAQTLRRALGLVPDADWR